MKICEEKNCQTHFILTNKKKQNLLTQFVFTLAFFLCFFLLMKIKVRGGGGSRRDS